MSERFSPSEEELSNEKTVAAPSEQEETPEDTHGALSPEMRTLIARQEMSPECVEVIASLRQFVPDRLGTMFHNVFNQHREESGQYLGEIVADLQARTERDRYKEDVLRASALFLALLDESDWHTCYLVARQLEEE